jgi:hypothetical protein
MVQKDSNKSNYSNELANLTNDEIIEKISNIKNKTRICGTNILTMLDSTLDLAELTSKILDD